MLIRRPVAIALLAAASAAEAKSPSCTPAKRTCLEAIAMSYINGLVSHDGASIPLSPNVRRTENALTNARGPHEVRESFARTTMVESTKSIRFFTDVAKGEVVAFFLLNVDLKTSEGGGDGTTKAGNTEYKVAITKPAGTYTVHETERFKIVSGQITEIEIIAHVEDGKGLGSGWPLERVEIVKAKK